MRIRVRSSHASQSGLKTAPQDSQALREGWAACSPDCKIQSVAGEAASTHRLRCQGMAWLITVPFRARCWLRKLPRWRVQKDPVLQPTTCGRFRGRPIRLAENFSNSADGARTVPITARWWYRKAVCRYRRRTRESTLWLRFGGINYQGEYLVERQAHCRFRHRWRELTGLMSSTSAATYRQAGRQTEHHCS